MKKETLKQISNCVNTFRINNGDTPFIKTGMGASLAKMNCNYAYAIPKYLENIGIIKPFGQKKGLTGQVLTTYKFCSLENPIHYNDFNGLVKKCLDSKRGKKSNSKNDPIIDKAQSGHHLLLTDQQLADELRRRGYDVTATKITAL